MTMYGIKLRPPINRWASFGVDRVVRWTEQHDRALRLDSATRAFIYAVQFLEMDPATFTIEPLPDLPTPTLRAKEDRRHA